MKNVCLVVIDGWGISSTRDDKGDAILHSDRKVVPELERQGSYTEIYAHGRNVGLPAGLMGNSEVGHLNIGAGRVVMQDIVRINDAVEGHEFGNLDNLLRAVSHCKANKGRLHLLGLVSDGGVHSHLIHLFELLDVIKEARVPHCFVHFFGDGRDTAPSSAVKYLEMLQKHLSINEYGILSTIIGRYYAMDRDKRWERTQIAFEALVGGVGEYASDPISAVKKRYENQQLDEFLSPIILNKEGLIRDGDAIITFNYRSDRMRQLSSVLGGLNMPFSSNYPLPKSLFLVTMTQYDEKSGLPVLFPPQNVKNVLAEFLSTKGIKQMHVAETEKYAHSTFFFNGGREVQFPLEERILVPSPKVATYDLKPEMCVMEVAEKVAESLRMNKYGFIMCNLAPPDMVGHTGNFKATIKAVEATDKAIGVIFEECKRSGYTLFVTSDHGNAEKMISDTGSPITSHTTNKVFLILTDKIKLRDGGSLCDVAPTVLDYMGLEKPPEMTGSSLIVH